MKEKFYYKTWFIILMLLIFAPVGIFLMWKGNKFTKQRRTVITIIFALFFILEMTQINSDNNNSNSSTKNTVSVSSKKIDVKEKSKNNIKSSNSKVNTEKKDTTKKNDILKPKEDLSNVAKQYQLGSGCYTVGVDIPAGTFNITALSGTGNLYSDNALTGINEMFGIDDGTGCYSSSYNNLTLKKGNTLTATGKLQIQLDYTDIKSNVTGRTYSESAVTLSNGNYVAGRDFEPGVYKIVAVSGQGNISSSNMFNGGLNEVFGVDDGTGFYNSEFINAELKDGVTLNISNGVTVNMYKAN